MTIARIEKLLPQIRVLGELCKNVWVWESEWEVQPGLLMDGGILR
jgi:hypothetical protein